MRNPHDLLEPPTYFYYIDQHKEIIHGLSKDPELVGCLEFQVGAETSDAQMLNLRLGLSSTLAPPRFRV